jgi:hypothetical protein
MNVTTELQHLSSTYKLKMEQLRQVEAIGLFFDNGNERKKHIVKELEELHNKAEQLRKKHIPPK